MRVDHLIVTDGEFVVVRLGVKDGVPVTPAVIEWLKGVGKVVADDVDKHIAGMLPPIRKERFEWNIDPKPIRDAVRKLNAGELEP